MQRRVHRTDGNHAAIRAEFRRLGCTWLDSYQLGGGAPDGFVGYGGLCMPIEVKDPTQSVRTRRLTPAQVEFHRTWTGGMRIVETNAQVAETVAVLKGWLEKIRNG